MKNVSVHIARILRHRPEAVGIRIDEHGWADVDELIEGVRRNGFTIDKSILDEIVATDQKMRFAYNVDKTRIRANQGHSIPVDVGMQEKCPPTLLFHGTAEKYIERIRREGIKKRTRNYVHLSLDESTAIKVGSRHGKPIVLKIDSDSMFKDGYKFYISANGVWQTDFVPFKYVIEEIKPK